MLSINRVSKLYKGNFLLSFLFFCLFNLFFINTSNAETIINSNITEDTTWTLEGSPYILNGNIAVYGIDTNDGIVTLTVEPGTNVKFASKTSGLYFGNGSTQYGQLVAEGTSDLPITFTSNNTEPSPGDWYGLWINSSPEGKNSIFNHCIVEYGGGHSARKYNINCEKSSPEITNSIIRFSNGHGIFLNGNSDPIIGKANNGNSIINNTKSGIYSNHINAKPSITDNLISDNGLYPLRTTTMMNLSGNTFSNNGINAIDVIGTKIDQDTIWKNIGVDYILNGNIAVYGTDENDGIISLTIEPGVTLKFASKTYGMKFGNGSSQYGQLIANGTSELPITFTSNNSIPSPGDWYGLWIYSSPEGKNSIFNHCIVEYGGGYSARKYNINCEKSSPEIINSVIRYSFGNGIYLKGQSKSNILNNKFYFNRRGIKIENGAEPLICRNDFENNTDYGVYSLSSTQLNIQNNWWGSDQGPNQEGDKIYGDVEFTPYLLAKSSNILIPNNPSGSIPENGSTDIILSQNYKKINLIWSGGIQNLCDSETSTIHYKIMFGKSEENLQQIAEIENVSTYQVTDLIDGTTYSWQIISETADQQVVAGPVWNFTLSNYKPVISVLGENPIILTVGDTFSDPGATALDEEDGEITTQITITNNVNLAAAGEYQVTYTVSDSSGNNSASVIRTVIVNYKLDDIDNDNLPDSWEMECFGNLDNGPDSDHDGDGVLNVHEFELGTDPTTQSPTFNIKTFEYDSSERIKSIN